MTDAGKYNQPTTNEGGSVQVSGDIGVANTSDVRIDPATEGNQSTIIARLTSLIGALASNATDTIRVIRTNTGPWSTITTGQETVTTSGTAVQFNGGASVSVPDTGEVRVNANVWNAGAVYVGDSTVTTGTGYEIPPGDHQDVPVDDVSSLYVDAQRDNDRVSWLVVT